MYLVKPGWKTLRMGMTPWEEVDGLSVLKVIEDLGRKCYKSEGAATKDSAKAFVQKRMDQGHIALLDHLHVMAEYISDRGISHEWLRHKLTEMLGSGIFNSSYDWGPMAAVQESTRYCNYTKSGGVVFIIPPWVDIKEGEYHEGDLESDHIFNTTTQVNKIWFQNCFNSENVYNAEISLGWTPQQARGDLLIKTKTEFVVTCSISEWRHIFTQRTSNAAHPQMRELMDPQLKDFQNKIPVIFDDIEAF